MSAPAPDRRYAFFIFLAYLAFVGYGSLVPFELRNYTLDQAIDQFTAIGYLELGAASRADWIANIVLYVPLAFLGCVWAVGMRTRNPLRYLAALPIFAFCIAIAVALEFTQVFFAPRTVSLNDLLAETLGSLGGIALFGLGRQRIAQLYASFIQGGRQSVIAAAVVFSFLYVTLSLFPYDFVISLQELASRLESDNQSWLIAGSCGSGLRCAAHQAGEVMTIAPLGLLVALAAPALSYRRIFMAGVVLGLVLEIVQLLLVSGTSQGLSLLWRGAGLAAGAVIGHILRRQGPAPVARIIRRAVPFAALPYILLLAALGGVFSAPWLPQQDALARLAETRFMPFYYHYFTTESAAVASLFAQAGMYAPVGLAVWALRPAGIGNPGTLRAALWAALLALPIEFLKLFAPPKHPDPTNLLIVAVGAAFACAVANWMERVLLDNRSEHERDGAVASATRQALSASGPALPASRDWPLHPAGIAIGLTAGLLALAGVMSYPVGTPWLIAALLGYGALLWHRPSLLFFAVPALLPAFDLSPITGRLWLDEFDLATLVALAMSYPRVYRIKPRPWPNRWWPAAAALLWTSWAVASARGLWPLLSLEGGLSDSSHSPLEAWLVGKGLLWALLLMPLMRRVPPENAEAIQNRMLNGLVAGLALVTLAVFWERHIFVGLLDFENVFRVTGTFSDMNTGGAYIETFLAFAFPVLAVRVLVARHWALKLAGIMAAASVSYAMLVTFSRGGYAGLVAGLVPVAVGTLRMRAGTSPRRWLVLGGVVAASLTMAVPVLSGGFAKARLERAGEDLAIREAHWKRALGLMDDGPLAALAGMGFGQYPMLYLLRAEGVRPPGTYSVMRDGDNPYLRLGVGETVFLDQIVAVEPGAQYTLSARVRSPEGASLLSVALCDKALLYSFECIWPQLPAAAQHQWNRVTVRVDAANLGGGTWPHRPVKLSLHNPGSGGPIDMDDVSLKARDGRELLANGGFDDGAARWLFVTDQDLAWHIHQQAVEMYFAQGGLGLTALAVLVVAASRVLWPALRSGNLRAAAFAGALTAFLTVGLLGSTMDTARLSMLFYLGAFAAGLLTCVDIKDSTGGTSNSIGRYRKPAPDRLLPSERP